MEERAPTDVEEVEATLVLTFRCRAKVPEDASLEERATRCLVGLLSSLQSEPDGLNALFSVQVELAGRRVAVPLEDLDAVRQFLGSR